MAVGGGDGAQVDVLCCAQGGTCTWACALVADLRGGQFEVSPGAGDQHACGARDVQACHAVDAGLGKAVVACAIRAVVLLRSKIQDGSPFFGDLSASFFVS